MRADRLNRPLVFTPRAWLKLQYLCHAGPTEVAGFGLSDADDPLRIDDVLVVRQWCTFATVSLDDAAVADLFDRMTDAGIPPARFARIWLHTHPGASVEPSPTDEETFRRVFGGCDWAVMAILGRTGRTSARLRLRAGPGAAVDLSTTVDWSEWPAFAQDGLDPHVANWTREYETLVEEILPPVEPRRREAVSDLFPPNPFGDTHAWF